MLESSLAGEVMKRAQMLVKIRGRDALEHANQMIESMRKTGDEEHCDYWHRIALQVELLVKENDPG